MNDKTITIHFFAYVTMYSLGLKNVGFLFLCCKATFGNPC